MFFLAYLCENIFSQRYAGLRSGGCCVPCGVSNVFVGRKAVEAGVMCQEHASVYELGMSQVCT